jgi:glycosyltransferase involved in cell wall biosynthesis
VEAQETFYMKILVIAEGISYPGVQMSGMGIIYQLQKRLIASGVEIHILTSSYSWSDSSWFRREEKKEKLRFYYIGLKPWDKVPLLGFVISKIFFLVEAFKLREEGFDIVHIYSSAPLLFRFAGFYRRVLRAKVIYTLSTYNTSFLGSFAWAGGAKSIARVICVTQHMKRTLEEKRGFKDKLVWLPLGFQLPKLSSSSHPNLKERLNIPGANKIILYLGPLEERKGAFALARAARAVVEKHPEVIFLFATYGPGGLDLRHNEHKRRIVEIFKGKEKCLRILEGWQDVSLLLKEADIFVIPQNNPHGTIAYPLTLLEAMAAAKAIVASDTWGVNELIRDRENGLLFPANNSPALSSALEELLEDKALSGALSEQAREDAGRYRLESMAEKLSELYRKVCQ